MSIKSFKKSIKRSKYLIKRLKTSIYIQKVDLYRKSQSNLITFDLFLISFDINQLFRYNLGTSNQFHHDD